MLHLAIERCRAGKLPLRDPIHDRCDISTHARKILHQVNSMGKKDCNNVPRASAGSA
ncbi:hypothetical protein OSJ77_19360 [Phyllobacterium sp. 0TCS1.6C]|uniref:hypothetical protein n=1 Tax=unclassified Phyllobacterium TaxID=2638441 RepID=UPI002264AA0E|nr:MULTISPECIES: hypothetical protein [unclassified Phyllobacterium]MCX8282355.1 hypothetical protein [Phyllobacterium sp. 0TCS1.6C]MCX8295292.1 hypothetical protein [Phyllobacterium sp. 0TCS1.6A]